MSEKTEKIKVHIKIDRDVYIKLWELIKAKYPIPYKKLHIEVNNALREYVEKHLGKTES